MKGGLLLIIASVTLVWYFMPRGRPRLWADHPFLQSMIPLAAVSGIAMGGAMVFSLFFH